MSAKFVLYCIPKFEVNEPRLQLLREAVELIGDKRWREILKIDKVPLSSYCRRDRNASRVNA